LIEETLKNQKEEEAKELDESYVFKIWSNMALIE
jgi:hypothetical protein